MRIGSTKGDDKRQQAKRTFYSFIRNDFARLKQAARRTTKRISLAYTM